MKRIAVALTTLLLFAANLPRQEPFKVQDDLEAIQGTWVLASVEHLGDRTDQLADLAIDIEASRLRVLPEAREVEPDLRLWRKTVTFQGTTFAFSQPFSRFNGGGHGWYVKEGTITLDGIKDPKQMVRHSVTSTFHEDDRVTASDDKGDRFCIYAINGETLRLGEAFDGQREHMPPSFVTDGQEDSAVLVFKRERPSAK